ncbi:MAG: 2-oxo acid dehydrogenase subunit E2 [Kyrpidia sp.]|nr:2-oxo acid dehydrogenase subunit E2 [Kyrpidia sp.]
MDLSATGERRRGRPIEEDVRRAAGARALAPDAPDGGMKTAVPPAPEVALLGVGRVESFLVLFEKGIEQLQRLPLSLTFDHRAVDGGPAAKFL